MPDRGAPSSVGLEALLRPAFRGRRPASRVAKQIAALGYEVTGLGEASLALRVSEQTFRRLFGCDPAAAPSAAPFRAWSEAPELKTPADLGPWVESLSQSRPGLRFR